MYKNQLRNKFMWITPMFFLTNFYTYTSQNLTYLEKGGKWRSYSLFFSDSFVVSVSSPFWTTTSTGGTGIESHQPFNLRFPIVFFWSLESPGFNVIAKVDNTSVMMIYLRGMIINITAHPSIAVITASVCCKKTDNNNLYLNTASEWSEVVLKSKSESCKTDCFYRNL